MKISTLGGNTKYVRKMLNTLTVINILTRSLGHQITFFLHSSMKYNIQTEERKILLVHYQSINTTAH